MALKERIIRITFSQGDRKLVLDESLDLSVKVQKLAIAYQQTANIDVFGMTTSMRQSWFSEFTAFNRQRLESNALGNAYVNVTIDAGYSSKGIEDVVTIFNGQVIDSMIESPPPNIGMKIMCRTNQESKGPLDIQTLPPYSVTFKALAQWVADQIGYRLDCSTSKDDSLVENPITSIIKYEAAPIMLMNAFQNEVIVFMDNKTLYCRDINAIKDVSAVPKLNEFIGVPAWTADGCSAKIMMRTDLTLISGFNVNSIINPTLNGDYVAHTMSYDLCSRRAPFYLNLLGSAPAS